MPKKNWTDEERKAFALKMKESREKAQRDKGTNPQGEAEMAKDAPTITPDPETHIAEEQGLDELKRQMQEVMETNALLKAAILGQGTQAQPQPAQNVNVNRQGGLVGEVVKYLVDPSNYPSPIERLMSEPRLKPLAFDYNYEMEYEVGVSSYETKTGVNMREPKFLVTLNRVVLDDQGNQTNKRYIARRMVFHEDPQAAIVIARDNGITIDEQDERLFLNEMRYLRVRDWLFDIFWPKPASPKSQIREEVIGGSIVQVFTKNSEDPSELDFSGLDKKLS